MYTMRSHLYICINVPLLQAAIANVAHSPVGTRLHEFTTLLKVRSSNPTRVAANFQFN